MTAHGPADAPPAVHIEDQGEPDVWGRVEAIVRLDGVIAARMHYAAWPGHLVLYELHPEPDAPADVGARIIDVLLDLYDDPGQAAQDDHGDVRDRDADDRDAPSNGEPPPVDAPRGPSSLPSLSDLPD